MAILVLTDRRQSGKKPELCCRQPLRRLDSDLQRMTVCLLTAYPGRGVRCLAFYWEKTAETSDEGRLLRDVLRGGMGISHRMLQALKCRGEISLNGAAVTVRARVHAGDRIVLRLPESEQLRVTPEQLPLQIVFEDEDILVVNKAAGMIVHPVPPEPSGTLANAIAWHWRQQGVNLPVRVVTRLDRDTSGLVLVAKHALAQHYYSRTAAALDKQYLALVHGRLAEEDGLIDAAIGIDPHNPVTRRIDPSGKPARTVWRRLAAGQDVSLLELRLLTGRTHQIRVHLAGMGHPLLGDRQYGGAAGLISRQALHCCRLLLCHVRNGQRYRFEAPLPADMRAACAVLAAQTCPQGMRSNPKDGSHDV